MKRTSSVLITMFTAVIILSCNQSQKEDSTFERRSADSTVFSSNRSLDTLAFGSAFDERKFIQTANLRFKVNRVEDAIRDIEFRSRALGGFVNFSHLRNTVQDSTDISLGPDSSLQSIHYRTEGVIIVRVPDFRMDSLLNELSLLSTAMLKREIRCDDVRVQVFMNRLSHKRAIKINQRLAAEIDSKGRKFTEIEEAEKTMEEKDESADNAIVSNLTLDDAVKFSTVSIEMYQDPVIVYKQIAREKIVHEYQAPFIIQLGESFSSGWTLVEDLILSICKYWSIVILCGVGYILFIKYFHSDKKMKATGH